MSIFCTECGTKVSDSGQTFCLECGAPVRTGNASESKRSKRESRATDKEQVIETPQEFPELYEEFAELQVLKDQMSIRAIIWSFLAIFGWSFFAWISWAFFESLFWSAFFAFGAVFFFFFFFYSLWQFQHFVAIEYQTRALIRALRPSSPSRQEGESK